MSKTYPAIFSYAPDGISISFPDLPGCLSCAATEAQAKERAVEALTLYLSCAARDGDPIPQPSPATAIKRKPSEKVYLVTADNL